MARVRSAWFTTSVQVFLISASVAYVLIPMAGVNVAKYYPVLHVFSTAPLEGEISMGFYGRVFVALIFGIVISFLHAGLSPFMRKLGLIKSSSFTSRANAVVAFALAIIVVEEWHKWGIEKRGLDGTDFYNIEFALLLLGVFIFVGTTALVHAAVERVKYVTRPDRPAQKSLNGGESNDNAGEKKL